MDSREAKSLHAKGSAPYTRFVTHWNRGNEPAPKAKKPDPYRHIPMELDINTVNVKPKADGK
jgi:hypothetical protein